MKNIKWGFIMLSMLTVLAIMSIGVAIAERSILGIVASILLVTIIMGLGFKTKKKLRERENQ
ncbi:YlaF family protein [Mangrovibacillus cuniculi]|uniref:YlaF family protein n=1 Tax=Mangrovibacillus cuniculi TaxID=2593652 RepID=A0A7S8CA65_9BACI|nr:YlaF family protein [Mangrovibacillus cuniculi]QPC46203.1 YlaF family protein [Mangrovibacillus cuniculi]